MAATSLTSSVKQQVTSIAFLRGENPGDLPLKMPTKYELVINMKAANVLAITVPPSLLSTSDKVIE